MISLLFLLFSGLTVGHASSDEPDPALDRTRYPPTVPTTILREECTPLKGLRPPFAPAESGAKSAPLIPVVNQGPAGVCYSASAVQMYQFLDPSVGALSFLETSISSKNENQAKFELLDGGMTCDALNHLFRNGACAPNELDAKLGGSGQVVANRIRTGELVPLRYIFNDFNSNQLDPVRRKYLREFAVRSFLNSDLLRKNPHFREIYDCLPGPQNGLPFDLAALDELEAVIGRYVGSDPRELLLRATGYGGCVRKKIARSESHFCRETKIQTLPPRYLERESRSGAVFRADQEKGFRQFNLALSRTPARPVGIGYCSNFFSNAYETLAFETCDAHASLVIDRRWSEERGGCQYLVRNSFGTGCERYGKAVAECDAGALWVDERILKGNFLDFETIEDLKPGAPGDSRK